MATIKGALEAVAAGHISDAAAAALFPVESWRGYEMHHDRSDGARDAYWRILGLLPQTDRPAYRPAFVSDAEAQAHEAGMLAEQGLSEE